MKIENRLPTSVLSLPGGKLKKGETWIQRLTEYLPILNDLVHEEVTDADRIEYGEDLVKALTYVANFSYLIRKERDQALAAGYLKYPKGEYNSEAQTALARNHASEEVRLRSLIEEIESALKLRVSLNNTAVVNYREFTKLHGAG